MSLTSQGRAAALFAAVKSTNPNFQQLNSDEQNALLANMKAIFGEGDLAYLVANTVVLPSALQAQAGATVATAGSAFAQTGSVTSTAPIVGTGSIS